MASYGTAQFGEHYSHQPFDKATNLLETRLARNRLATSLLLVLSILQIGCGIAVIILQVILNEQILHDFDIPAQYYGILSGTVMILNGMFCTFTAAFKTFYLMVTTSILAVSGYLVSILNCGLSINILNSFDASFMAKVASLLSSTIDQAKTELIAMAALGGINFVLTIIVSVVLCWSYECLCCRSRVYNANRPLLENAVQVL